MTWVKALDQIFFVKNGIFGLIVKESLQCFRDIYRSIDNWAQMSRRNRTYRRNVKYRSEKRTVLFGIGKNDVIREELNLVSLLVIGAKT